LAAKESGGGQQRPYQPLSVVGVFKDAAKTVLMDGGGKEEKVGQPIEPLSSAERGLPLASMAGLMAGLTASSYLA
jgi:hypothetical protein